MSTLIAIRSVAPDYVVPAEHVYFAFGSGSLGYDCVSCGAKCCRGYGYLSSTGRELDVQLGKRPALKYFVRPSSKTTVSIGNCAPGCFFLTEAGGCGIQAEEGFAAKPETCRLFPFNNMLLVGDQLIVMPHASLCPMSVNAASSQDPKSDHRFLLDVMSEKGISGKVARIEMAASAARAAVSIERDVLELCRGHERGAFDDLLAGQLAASRGLPIDIARATVKRHWQLCSEMLGLGEPVRPDDPELSHLMGVLTPFLRVRFMWGDGPGVGSSGAPPYEQLVGYLAALYHVAALAKQAGMSALTFQSLSQLGDSFKGPLRLLSLAGSVVSWSPDADVTLKTRTVTYQIPAIRIAKYLQGLTPGCHVGGTFGDAFIEHCPVDGAERVEFLRFLAAGLLDKIEVKNQPMPRSVRTRTGTSVKLRLQRWGLRRCSESILQMAWRA